MYFFRLQAVMCQMGLEVSTILEFWIFIKGCLLQECIFIISICPKTFITKKNLLGQSTISEKTSKGSIDSE